MQTKGLVAQDWERHLRDWAAPPGSAEQQKIERAEREVRAAIRASRALQYRNVEVFAQGSYRNRTNVPQESDVDICVKCSDTFMYDVVPDDDNVRKAAESTYAPATYRYSDYKNDLQNALVSHFGSTAVSRGDIAFTVHETTTRVDADVVAAFEHRRIVGRDAFGRLRYLVGTDFFADSGRRIINWPQQHYDNGVAKNAATRERFKAMVRVLKNLRHEMKAANIGAANPIPSYFIECLVFNVSSGTFGHSTYYAELQEVLRELYHATKEAASCQEWGEVNELKYLFRNSQPWTREAGNAFVLAAWRYMGFSG